VDLALVDLLADLALVDLLADLARPGAGGPGPGGPAGGPGKTWSWWTCWRAAGRSWRGPGPATFALSSPSPADARP